MILEVITAIAQLEAGMIAVAGLIAQILDDGINRCLLNDTGRVASIAAELCLTAGACHDQGGQQGSQTQSQQHYRWI